MAQSPGQQTLFPRSVRPIVVIGAGGIVKDAHLPAYRIAGFPVAGIFDLDSAKAEALAREFGLPPPRRTLAETLAHAPAGAVFDLAVPAGALAGVLAALPDGVPVLIQKPFGENLEQARRLRELCRRKGLKAAVNFQLRYAPCIVAARRLVAAGAIGDLHDLEVRVTVSMPWELWGFLARAPRIEILYHSIHYIDLIRSFLGEPHGVYAKTVRHPRTPGLEATRTTLALDYGDLLRATVTANHGHAYGPRHQESYVKWEGTRGAIKARLGLLLDYPRGEPDALEACAWDGSGPPDEGRGVPFEGNWYPHAFIGTMASVMAYAGGETAEPPTHVDDAFRTMAVVEAAYASSAGGGTPIPQA